MKTSAGSRRAFVLVAALILTAFLLLSAMTAAVLLRVSLGAARASSDRARAMLSARAALKIALGEMQSAVGPDRRVTGEAALFDDTAPADGGAACVWRTGRLLSEGPDAKPFVFRDPDGALRDRRGVGYEARKQLLRVLASGGGDYETFRDAPAMALPATCEGAPVAAPAETSAAGDFRFAWAAADEGVKWRVTPKTPVIPGDPVREGNGLATVAGWRADGACPRAEHEDFAGWETEGLIGAGESPAAARSLTAVSAGVLANSRDGGLKRDLTPYLLSSGYDAPIRDTDPLIADDPVAPGPFADAGPRFGILRRWATLGETAKAGPLIPDAGTRHRDANPAKPATKFHSGTHPDLPEILAPVSPVVAPVLTEAAVWLRLSGDDARRDATGVPLLKVHVHPRVVLWNPYAAPLASARYLVHLRAGGSPVFRLVKNGVKLTGAIPGWRVYDTTLVNYAITQGTLLFVVECPTLPPGESLVFAPPASAPLYGKSAVTKTWSPLANRLVPVAGPTTANFWSEGYDAFEDAALKTLAGASIAGESWRLEKSSAEDFAAALSLLPSGDATWKSLLGAPTLRYVSCSVKCGSGTTPAPGWPATRTESLLPETDAPPPPGTRDGVRLRRLFEPPANAMAYSPYGYAEIAPAGDYSPLATYAFTHPFENATPAATGATGSAEFFGLFTRDNAGPESDFAAYAPAGGVAAHPFGLPATFPGVRSAVIAGFPDGRATTFSWADFADAPLSPFAWHPARLLGESGATPVAPRDASAWPANLSSWAATGAGRALLEDAVRIGESPEFPRVADMRFETNHATWDRFVFLTGDAVRRKAFASSPASDPLPGARIRPATTLTADDLTGPEASVRGPAGVLLSGAFNVNSVNVGAWEQWLRRLRGVMPEAGSEVATPFARFPTSPGEGSDRQPDPRKPAFWHGFRRLSDEESGRLAREIVKEVKRRGPFVGVADFVNRRLSPEPFERDPSSPSSNACGVLEAAIGRTKLNAISDAAPWRIPRGTGLPGTRHLADQKAWSRLDGFPGALSQADLLRAGGDLLAARSDTFRVIVRAEVPAAGGGVAAAALEAIVQRTPEPVEPDRLAPTEPTPRTADSWGRRLRIVRLKDL